jgi:methionyl-tRNA formyltransferase
MTCHTGIAFFGSPPLASASLKALVSEFSVKLVVTQPQKKRGRGRSIRKTSVDECASEYRIPVVKPERIKSDFISTLRQFGVELVVVVAYGQILPEAVVSFPRFGALNLHGSLLPRYRGASPIQSALLNGERETGITLQMMAPQMDAGDILAQEKIPIEREMTAEKLLGVFIERAPSFLVRSIHRHLSDELTPVKQEEREATYCTKLKKHDGLIRWESEARDITRKIRALNIWPVAYTTLDGKILRIYDARIHPASTEKVHIPGRVGKLDHMNGIIVETGKGRVALIELQMENKRRMNHRDFVNGYRNLEGKLLGSEGE